MKRYSEYPINVPRKLIKLLRKFNEKQSDLAAHLHVNSGRLSALLNHGIEPTDKTPKGIEARQAMFLTKHKKKIKRDVIKIKEPKPYYLIKWNHLSKDERHKVMKQYIEWKDKLPAQRTGTVFTEKQKELIRELSDNK